MSNTNNIEADVVLRSPWRNCYWFARMFLNTDQYGALGKKEDLLRNIVQEMDAVISQPTLNNEDKKEICLNILQSKISQSAKKGTKVECLYGNLFSSIEQQVHHLEDIVVLMVTIQYIVLPTNYALSHIPSDDVAFCHTTAKNILDTLGEKNVNKVIATWDHLGVHACLDVEREEIVREFTKLRTNLSALSFPRSDLEDNAILTAFVQEFERRVGQKRKARAGNSLEDVSTFLFDYYNFKSHPKPDHFQSDLEVDKWFKCADGWLIGISCKRTLRERWKQVSAADQSALARNKIKEIWHLTTYDRDLSDEKIAMLGQQHQIFYLSDDSQIYQRAKGHPVMKDYVRPLSRLIEDIRKEQKKHN